MAVRYRFPAFVMLLALAGACPAANFGTVVPLSGNVADIALDEAHGRLYIANFGAYRVEVLSTSSKSLQTPLAIAAPPSAVAVSPDAHYLVVGEYEKPSGTPQGGFQVDTGGLDTYDLINGGPQQHMDLPCPVLTVSFGSDGQALVVCRTNPTIANIFSFNPATGNMQSVGTVAVSSQDLSVPLATAPSQIIQASSGVSGDLNTIMVLASAVASKSTPGQSILIRYDVPSHTLSSEPVTSTPPFGPRAVSVDQTGFGYVAGWGDFRYINSHSYLFAQFPSVTGAFNEGSHAWDRLRNLIYGNFPNGHETAVLSVAAADNLAIQERVQLQESLGGKSLMSSDMSTMYAASQSGVTILPVAQLSSSLPQISAVEEDLLFQADACSAGLLTQTLHITNPYNSASADFTLSLPDGTQGVTFSSTSGTTPAQIQITIDPSQFQTARGTTAVSLTIKSTRAVNLPSTVRLLINTHDVNQRGQIVNVPGKIVDMLADPARGRLYLLRQDKNEVLIMNMASRQLISAPLLRTGNTPVHMAMTTDSHYLIVGNDNSQIGSVLDLNLLQDVNPILFPSGHYPRAIGISNSGMFATARLTGEVVCLGDATVCPVGPPMAVLDHIDFAAPDYSTADTPITLNGMTDPSIYSNNLPTADGVIAPSPDANYLFLALASGDVAEYDVSALTWANSRKDFDSLAGAYGAFTGFLPLDSSLPLTTIDYVVGPNLLDLGLAPLGSPFADGTAVSSGVAIDLGVGLRTTATAANAPGVIERFSPADQSVSGITLMVEAPLTSDSMTYPVVGQIGETILSFTRTLAVSPDQNTIFASTISGLTVLPATFDQTLVKPVITRVVSGADGTSAAASGGIIDILGTGLAAASAGAGGYPLPMVLGQACVTVDGTALPLFSAAPNLLAAELPFTLTGSATMVVRTSGGVSDPFAFTVQSTAPALFHNASNGVQSGLPAVYRDDNGALVSFTNPIHPNSSFTMYLTGLGPTTPLPALGAAAPSNPVAAVNALPTVTLGGENLAVTSATLVPGVASVYQVKATTAGIRAGMSVPLTISSGSSSTTLLVRVVSP